MNETTGYLFMFTMLCLFSIVHNIAFILLLLLAIDIQGSS